MRVHPVLPITMLGLWLVPCAPALAQQPLPKEEQRWLTSPNRVEGTSRNNFADQLEPVRYAPDYGSPVSTMGTQQRRPPRFQLPGMPPAFPCDPLGLDSGEDPLETDDPTTKPLSTDDADLLGGIHFYMGEDNLYFDPRRQGQMGGAGFCKVQSLMQLLDWESTSLSLGMQAVLPAGPEVGGVPNGPTWLSPTLAWFQELGEGAAVHGFVGKQIQANSRWREHLGTDVECGMAFQYPLLNLDGAGDQGLYVFLQALGRFNYENDPAKSKMASWEVVPGIHWRMNDRCWLSMGGSRFSLITCSWKF